MIEVVHFHRKPRPRAFSIERLFSYVRAYLPSDILCRKEVSPFLSGGILRRLSNIAIASLKRGEINHVTGDVHFLALGLPARKTIVTVHDCGFLDSMTGPARIIHSWFWFRLPLAKCQHITAVSEATRSDLVNILGINPDKISVIYNCIGPEYSKLRAHVDTACWTAKSARILMIGTAPTKNLERSAEALAGVDCTVEIIGSPSTRQLTVFNRNSVKYKVLGTVSPQEVLSAYRRSNIVLFPSLKEGFGMPIIEAQAVGRTVITSNRSSMPEVAGGAAILVNPESADSIRKGVLSAVNNSGLRNELIVRGFQNVRRFSPEYIASQYANLYRNLIG